jgi:predicted TIM-barrel fold metal-dependent hydrolase
VWGSDWPHINYFETAQMPDDGVLFNLLARWLPAEADRQRVLVTNPAGCTASGNSRPRNSKSN